MALVFEQWLIEHQPTVTSFFSSAVKQGKLHHAYLFVGGDRDDKRLVAKRMAQLLNCSGIERDTTNSAASHCLLKIAQAENRCQNCRWIDEEKHPRAWFDLKNGDSTASSIISVERARQVSEELAKTSSFRRILVVPDASEDVFHRPAANALLKTIEEPKSLSLFFFFARSQEQVLSTIVSRCQIVPFRRDGRKTMGPIALMNANGNAQGEHKGKLDLLREMIGIGEEQLVSRLERLRAVRFFDWTRKHGDHSQSRQQAFEEPLRALSDSEQAVSVAQALELAKALHELIDDDLDYEAVLDGAILTELEIIGNKTITDPHMSLYVRRLLSLEEATKDQLNHYVSRKAAVESFVLDWSNLRNKLVG